MQDKEKEIFLNTARSDRKAFKKHLTELFELVGTDVPRVHWLKTGPMENIRRDIDTIPAAPRIERRVRDIERLSGMATKGYWSSDGHSWGYSDLISLYEAVTKEKKLLPRARMQAMIGVLENCCSIVFKGGVIYALDRPSIIKVNAEGKLHSEDGPAVRYKCLVGTWDLMDEAALFV